jgi:diaminohydroxyphosphoribosylaminopyrimidine deaminase/5-amino-6-(5-phosphoribosylamino)uracil reductase
MPNSWQEWEVRLMRRLLRMAGKKIGSTFPNPVVGAAVVKQGKVLAIGVHARSGAAHAEVLALEKAGKSAKGSTMYVTLEPCTHWGKTPPCTDALIATGVRRVVYAIRDPNPEVQAKSAAMVLKAAGIAVDSGLCEAEARQTNAVYFKNREHGRPFITLKAATSLDGRIALGNGQSKYLTGPESRRAVHRLRATCDAVLVGVETVLKDDPQLTVRSGRRPAQPLKIVLDSGLRTPEGARIFADGAPVLLVAQENAPRKTYTPQTHILRVPSLRSPDFWPSFLDRLYREFGICHLLIEGGAQVFTSALEAKVVDKVMCLISPQFLMAKDAISLVSGTQRLALADSLRLSHVQIRRYGDDVCVTGAVGGAGVSP